MSRKGPDYHPSHKPADPIAFPRRSRDSIAARNRAWRQLCEVLPLPRRFIRESGEVVER